jgi:hypothetical protein
MKRPSRSEDGYYHIDGKKYKELFGSRIQVWNGTAYKTTGELTRSHFMMNKHHRIVSVKKYKTAKKEKRLQKYGYFAEKGKFGYVKRDTKKARKSRKVRGGSSLSGAELGAAYGAGSAAPAAAPAAATPAIAESSSAPDAGSKN